MIIGFRECARALNGVTGASCSYLGDNRNFKRLSIDEILRKAKGAKALINGLNWSAAGSLELGLLVLSLTRTVFEGDDFAEKLGDEL